MREQDANRLAEVLITFHTIFCSAYGTNHKGHKVFQRQHFLFGW